MTVSTRESEGREGTQDQCRWRDGVVTWKKGLSKVLSGVRGVPRRQVEEQVWCGQRTLGAVSVTVFGTKTFKCRGGRE